MSVLLKLSQRPLNFGNDKIRRHCCDDNYGKCFQVCGQIEHGMLALFGPSDLLLGSHIQSLCDALDIPHLEAR